MSNSFIRLVWAFRYLKRCRFDIGAGISYRGCVPITCLTLPAGCLMAPFRNAPKPCSSTSLWFENMRSVMLKRSPDTSSSSGSCQPQNRVSPSSRGRSSGGAGSGASGRVGGVAAEPRSRGSSSLSAMVTISAADSFVQTPQKIILHL